VNKAKRDRVQKRTYEQGCEAAAFEKGCGQGCVDVNQSIEPKRFFPVGNLVKINKKKKNRTFTF
jgi:hypothetical protein